MTVKQFSQDYADVYLGSHHFCVENVGGEFVIEEITLPCFDLRYIACVASMEIAFNYLSSFENYLDLVENS